MPHVSAAQCTKPDVKSAVIMPQNAATTTTNIRSVRKCLIIRTKFNTINIMAAYTQKLSWARLPMAKLEKTKNWKRIIEKKTVFASSGFNEIVY